MCVGSVSIYGSVLIPFLRVPPTLLANGGEGVGEGEEGNGSLGAFV